MNVQNTIPFIRKQLSHKPEEDIKNAEERFVAFAILAHSIATRLAAEQDDKVP